MCPTSYQSEKRPENSALSSHLLDLPSFTCTCHLSHWGQNGDCHTQSRDEKTESEGVEGFDLSVKSPELDPGPPAPQLTRYRKANQITWVSVDNQIMWGKRIHFGIKQCCHFPGPCLLVGLKSTTLVSYPQLPAQVGDETEAWGIWAAFPNHQGGRTEPGSEKKFL